MLYSYAIEASVIDVTYDIRVWSILLIYDDIINGMITYVVGSICCVFVVSFVIS